MDPGPAVCECVRAQLGPQIHTSAPGAGGSPALADVTQRGDSAPLLNPTNTEARWGAPCLKEVDPWPTQAGPR